MRDSRPACLRADASAPWALRCPGGLVHPPKVRVQQIQPLRGVTPPLGGVCALDFDIEHKTPAFSERRGWGAGGHPQLGPVRGRGLDLSWPQVQDRPRGRIGVADPLPPTEQKRSSSPVDARARDAQNGGPQGALSLYLSAHEGAAPVQVAPRTPRRRSPAILRATRCAGRKPARPYKPGFGLSGAGGVAAFLRVLR